MSEYFFAPPAPASVAVAGSERRFAVHRIYCVGLNYADHVRELGSDPASPPVFFMKPADALVFAETVARFSVFYQPSADGQVPALRRRLQSADAVKAAETV